MNGAVPSFISITDSSVYAIAISRLVVAVLCVSGFQLFRGKSLTRQVQSLRQNLGLYFLLGFVFFLHWYFYTLAPKGISDWGGSPAGASLGFATLCAWVIIQDCVLANKWPRGKEVAAVLLCMAGAAATAISAAGAAAVTSSLIIGMVGAIPFAVLVRLHSTHSEIDIFDRMLGQFLFACVCFVITLPLLGSWKLSLSTQEVVMLVGFMGIWGTFINHSLIASSQKHVPSKVIQGTISVLFVPSAIFAAAIVAGEAISISMAFGAVLIVLGMIMTIKKA